MPQESPRKFQVLDLIRQPKPVEHQYINMDARFLLDLVKEMEDGEEPDATTVRLRSIAHNLEMMDEKYRNLSSDPAFAAGVAAERVRVYGRTNLPLQSSEIKPDLAAAIAASGVVPRRVEAAKNKPLRKPNPLSVAGITLDLSLLDPKE